MSLLANIGRQVFDVGTDAAKIPVSVLGKPLDEGTRNYVTRVLTGLIEDSPATARRIGRVQLLNKGVTKEETEIIDRAYLSMLGVDKKLEAHPGLYDLIQRMNPGQPLFGIREGIGLAPQPQLQRFTKEKGALEGLSLREKLSVVRQRLETDRNRQISNSAFGPVDIVGFKPSPDPYLMRKKGSIVAHLPATFDFHQRLSEARAAGITRGRLAGVGYDAATPQELLGHVLTHEFGHHVDFTMRRPDKAIRFDNRSLLQKIDEELDPFTQYGKTSYHEFFAETFTQLRKDPSVVPRRLRREFRDSKLLRKIYNPKNMTPLYTDGPPGQRVIGRDPNFGASMADTVGEKNSKNWVIPNALPFPKIPRILSYINDVYDQRPLLRRVGTEVSRIAGDTRRSNFKAAMFGAKVRRISRRAVSRGSVSSAVDAADFPLDTDISIFSKTIGTGNVSAYDDPTLVDFRPTPINFTTKSRSYFYDQDKTLTDFPGVRGNDDPTLTNFPPIRSNDPGTRRTRRGSRSNTPPNVPPPNINPNLEPASSGRGLGLAAVGAVGLIGMMALLSSKNRSTTASSVNEPTRQILPNDTGYSDANMIQGQMSYAAGSGTMRYNQSMLGTPDQQLMTQRRHSSARDGLPVRSSASGVFLR